MREDREVGKTATMSWDAPTTVEGFAQAPANRTQRRPAGARGIFRHRNRFVMADDSSRRQPERRGTVASPQARLVAFTSSRQTLPADERPVAGETFIFTSFAGEPQVFLTRIS